MNAIRTFIILLLMGILFQCSNFIGSGGEGNGSETIARGVVVDSAGVPASGVPVQLLPATYNPVASDTLPAQWRAVTNDKGEYRLASIPAGTYALEAGLASAGLMALVRRIEITDTTDEAVVDTGVLEKTGTILIQLGGLTPDSGDYVYLPGTSNFTFINEGDRAAGQAVLSGVPVGTYTELIYVDVADSTKTDLVTDSVTMHSGGSIASAYANWNYRRQLIVNTAGSGADVSETVYNFPVVVRLSTATFDFSQTQNGGRDIRFAKSDGSPLPHEIERWDPVTGLAEVWVKVDTIFGNDSVQAITMYWGNPVVADSSNGTEVFDTAAGFLGVWHLGENTGTVGDATINRFNGSRKGKQTRAQGCVGDGQRFYGAGDYTEMGNVANPGTKSFSISAWVKLSTSKGYRTIISKSNGTDPSPSYGWTLEIGPDGELIVFLATDTGNWGEAGTFVLSSKGVGGIADTVAWHHIAVVIDRSGNNGCRVYIDGADVSDVPAGGDITSVGLLTNALPLRIGAESDGDAPWVGNIDECIISPTARSGAWIRLCYSNQGPGDRLVKFR